MTKVTNLPALLAACEKTVQDPEFTWRGYFDEKMNYHFYDELPYIRYGVLTPWDWTVWPELRRECVRQGLEIPVDSPPDNATTF